MLWHSHPWTDEKELRWQQINKEFFGRPTQAGRWDATSKQLCSIVRKALEGSQTIQ